MVSSIDSLPLCSRCIIPYILPVKYPLLKDPTKETLGLPWNSGRALLDRAIFRKWYGDVIPQVNHCNIKISLLVNGYPEDINIFRRHFQDNIISLYPKAKVWKAKLQTCTEPSKVVFIIYSAHTIQFNLHIKIPRIY